MERSPEFLDGARVLQVASLAGLQATGKTRHYRGIPSSREALKNFAALAIAQYDGKDGFYLFYCNSDWNVMTDTFHDDLAGAIEQANREYGVVRFDEVALAE